MIKSCDKCKKFIDRNDQCIYFEIGIMGGMHNAVASWYHYSCYKEFTSPEQAVVN